jgi:BirA family biotin operon repressor/biotin-[acetyl-CoA-carboxylase] ligase
MSAMVNWLRAAPLLFVRRSVPMSVVDSRLLVPDRALRALLARPLAAGLIRRELDLEAAVATVTETGSTSADLLARQRVRRSEQPEVLATVAQTAGRGRLGRRWHSLPGSALLFSVAVPLAAAAATAPAVTLACGVAVAEGLRTLGVAAQLKWPNDLLFEHRKLGGILVESALDGAGQRALVVGVGVNLWDDGTLRAQVGDALATVAQCVDLATLARCREAWIARLARAVITAVWQFETDGFVAFQPRYMQRFAWVGCPVDVLDQGARIAQGRALGVDGQGRLLVDTAAGVAAFSAGEVSLRRQPAPRPEAA